MKENVSSKDNIDRIFNSVDKIVQAAPSPFFYAKVLAKIGSAKASLWERWSAFFLRPTIAFAGICLIIVVNVFVLYTKLNEDALFSSTEEVAAADEYNDTATALYDLENEKP